LALFASVIQGLDAQHLRIHDTLTGHLRCDHAIAPKATINSLDWGYYGGKHSALDQHQSKKKRKRNHEVNGEAGGDVVLAFGTSDSEIEMFSPAEGKVVGRLHGAHTQGIRDFKFTDRKDAAEGWSLGGDGKLAQWDLRTGTCTRQVEVDMQFPQANICARILSLPTMTAATLARPVPTHPPVICASETAYIIDPVSVGLKVPQAFSGSNNPIRTIITSSPLPSRPADAFLTAADSGPYINVFDVKKGRPIGILIAETDVQSVAFHAGAVEDGSLSEESADQGGATRSPQILAAVTSDGVVELFPRPFQGFDDGHISSNLSSLKAQRKQMTRKNEGVVKLIRPDKSSTVVHVIDASFQEADLVMAWTQEGVNVLFERVRWKDESTGEIILKGVKEIVPRKSGSGIGVTVMNGVKDLGKSKVDDSQAVVVKGGDLHMANQEHEVIVLSSDEESGSDENEPSEREDEHMEEAGKVTSDGDAEMIDAEEDDDQVEVEGQATFGDLLRAAAPGTVDVPATFEETESKAIVHSSVNRSLQLPTGMSLGTVLTQSLKTNDTNLLETCLHTKDLEVVRATIERLDSALAAGLLQKLAERLHSRPGRAGNMMVWIQWTLICHGGYLAGQPDLMKKLSSLHRVVKERASSLQPLLSLKGKLDMLDGQMELRRRMQSNARAAHAADEDDEEGVIYVEGQDESDSEAESIEAGSEDDVAPSMPRSRNVRMGGRSSRGRGDRQEDSDVEEDDMPTTVNGVVPDSEDEDESGGDSDLIDDEASETDDDSGDDLSGDEVDHDDVDSADDDGSDVNVNSPPAKRASTKQLGNGPVSKK